jgi:transposase
VKPFVKGSKNDAADAEGVYEAALRPTMRFVPVKSIDQQDLQSLHRARERVVCARTALINHMRGLLGEYGVILPQGTWRFLAQAQDAIAVAELSDLTRELFGDLLDELRSLDLRLDKLDQQLLRLFRTNEACPRLSKLPGVGPVIATALVAAVERLTTAVTSGPGGNSPRGLASCLVNIRPGANLGSAELAGAPITISDVR